MNANLEASQPLWLLKLAPILTWPTFCNRPWLTGLTLVTSHKWTNINISASIVIEVLNILEITSSILPVICEIPNSSRLRQAVQYPTRWTKSIPCLVNLDKLKLENFLWMPACKWLLVRNVILNFLASVRKLNRWLITYLREIDKSNVKIVTRVKDPFFMKNFESGITTLLFFV